MKLKKNNFNLVEIIIAMGIVVVCITTIIGLFSVGMEMSKDAVEKAYTNSIIQQISGLIETKPDFEDKVPTTEPADGSVPGLEAACTTVMDSSDPFLQNVEWDGSNLDVIKISYKTTLDSGSTVPDFTCYAKLWYTTSPRTVATTDGGTATVDTDTLNIEITWPYKMSYVDRVASGNVITFAKVLQQ